MIFQITDNNDQNNQANENKKYQDISKSTGSSSICGNIKNMSTIVKSAKSKISNLTKSKKSDLAKFIKLTLTNDFAKANFKIDFLTPKAKKPLYL